MEIYILDDTLRRVKVVDKFESVIWSDRFSSVGDFKLIIQSTVETRSLFVKGGHLGINTSLTVMIIETIIDENDSEGRRLLTIQGRSLESILLDRVAKESLNPLTNVPMGAATVTIATPAVVTYLAHGKILGDVVYFPSTTGALPTGLAINTLYYVIPINANTFNLATSLDNAIANVAIATTGTQSGVHTLWWQSNGKWRITGTPGAIVRSIFQKICVDGVLSASDIIPLVKTVKNYATNRGFETDVTGVSTFGVGATAVQSSLQAKRGTKSLLVTPGAASYTGALYQAYAGLVLGQIYTITAWVYRPTTGQVYFGASFLNASVQPTLTGGVWTKLVLTGAYDNTNNFAFFGSAIAAEAPFYVDGITIVDGSVGYDFDEPARGDSLFPADTNLESDTVITVEFPIQSVYEVTKQILDVYDLGFRLYRGLDDQQIYYNVYAGSDRTTGQSVLPSVVFSPALDNLSDTSELSSIAQYKNVALVVSPNETKYVYAIGADSTTAGFVRRVLFVDASDITYSPGAILTAALLKRGQDALAENQALNAFDGEIPQNSKYKYNIDYFLGDLVEKRNDDGVTNNMRVTENIQVADVQGERSYPTLSTKLLITPGSWLAWESNQVWNDVPDVNFWDTI